MLDPQENWQCPWWCLVYLPQRMQATDRIEETPRVACLPALQNTTHPYRRRLFTFGTRPDVMEACYLRKAVRSARFARDGLKPEWRSTLTQRARSMAEIPISTPRTSKLVMSLQMLLESGPVWQPKLRLLTNHVLPSADFYLASLWDFACTRRFHTPAPVLLTIIQLSSDNMYFCSSCTKDIVEVQYKLRASRLKVGLA